MRTSATLSLACSTQASPASTHWNPFTTSVTSHGWWVRLPSPQVKRWDPGPVSPSPTGGTTGNQVALGTTERMWEKLQTRHGVGWALAIKHYLQGLGCLWCRVDLWPHNKVTQRFSKEVLIDLQAVASSHRCKNKNTWFLLLSGLLERPEASGDPAPITALQAALLEGNTCSQSHPLPLVFQKSLQLSHGLAKGHCEVLKPKPLHHPGSWRGGFLTRWTHYLCSWSLSHTWTHSFPVPLETREIWEYKRKTSEWGVRGSCCGWGGRVEEGGLGSWSPLMQIPLAWGT